MRIFSAGPIFFSCYLRAHQRLRGWHWHAACVMEAVPASCALNYLNAYENIKISLFGRAQFSWEYVNRTHIVHTPSEYTMARRPTFPAFSHMWKPPYPMNWEKMTGEHMLAVLAQCIIRSSHRRHAILGSHFSRCRKCAFFPPSLLSECVLCAARANMRVCVCAKPKTYSQFPWFTRWQSLVALRVHCQRHILVHPEFCLSFHRCTDYGNGRSCRQPRPSTLPSIHSSIYLLLYWDFKAIWFQSDDGKTKS